MKAYEAAIAPLQAFVQMHNVQREPAVDAMKRQEAAYMIACSHYETKHPQRLQLLQEFLKACPDTPHRNRILVLMAGCHFAGGDYAATEQLLQEVEFDLLPEEECNDYIYYRAYVDYKHGRYNVAMAGLQMLQEVDEYKSVVPCYMAEIYLNRGENDQAEAVATDYLNRYATEPHTGEMQRVLGVVMYRRGDYRGAMEHLDAYRQAVTTMRRDARYMLGLACYHCGVYTQVPELLGSVTAEADDALAQNAYLHMGLAYLQMMDKSKARMAFEQAAASNADRAVKEQAAYNYALCLHETSYSAFGESVTVFERFLNEFPESVYADKVSTYLVEVYMDTRSYEAALQSINRIGQPGRAILEAKQKILFRLGTQAFANTQLDRAADYFDRSIAIGKYNRQTKAEALYWRGEVAYRQGRMQAAESDFSAYLNENSAPATQMVALAHYNLGYIAFNQEAYSAAERRFRDFIRREKESNAALLADAYNRLGDCALQGRRFDEAEGNYTKAESLHTSAGDYAYYRLALVAGLQKDYAGKVAWLNRLATRYPSSPYVVSALYEKGRAYVQTGDSRQAIETFGKLVEEYPESAVSRKAAAEIGLLYYQNDDYEQAIEAYKRVVTRYPGSEEARLAMRDLKSLYVDANRVEEFAALAAQLPNVRFEASEQDSLTYIAAERVYMKGEPVAARESLERYLQSYPDGAFRLNAHYYLATIARQQQDQEGIVTHTGSLLEYPDSPYTEEALLMRSEVLFGRKQYAEAMADYQALQARATTAERRQAATTGVLRCAALLHDDAEVIAAATALLAEAKLLPEQREEALYLRAKAYLHQKADRKAGDDLKELARDTRTLYGAEAKYLLAQQHYAAGRLEEAEKEVLDFIEQSTPHAYWLARSFVLLADIYMATGKNLDARQYLLSLQQNYDADDDIAGMIEERLNKLKTEN